MLNLQKSAVVNLLNQSAWEVIPSELNTSIYTDPNPDRLPELYNCWLVWRGNTWIKQHLSSSLICMDVETTNDMKNLAIASAVDMLTGELYSWYCDPCDPKLLDIDAETLVIAHRACFEMAYIERNYTPEDPLIRGICTFAMAAQFRHPIKSSLYRMLPDIPKHKYSSDLSLKDLYYQATRNVVDKSFVDVFIKSVGDSWRDTSGQQMLNKGIHEAYLTHKLDKFAEKNKLNLPAELYLSKPALKEISTKKKKIEYLSNLTTVPTHEWQKVDLVCNKLSILNPVPSPLLIPTQLAEIIDKQQTTDQTTLAWQYNIKDTLMTVKVIKMLLDKDIPRIDPVTFRGLLERSIPMFFVDPSFPEQVETIDQVYDLTNYQLNCSATFAVDRHYKQNSTWDGQDWELNSERCGVNKRGKPKWYAGNTFKFTSKEFHIASQLTWKGQVMKRFLTPKPIRFTDDGDYEFAPDTETKPRGVWGLSSLINDNYEETLMQMTVENTTPWENPQSSDTKEFKGVTNPFSNKLLLHWKNGDLGCRNTKIIPLIKKYITTSYWRSIRKRILQAQLVMAKCGYYAVAPKTNVSGTVTGRSIDGLFLVLAKPDEEKIGSELQGMFCAPPGYKIVQFDLDSAQARFAALLSDADFAIESGFNKVTLQATEFSKMVFSGSKKEHTTIAHSLGRLLGFDYKDRLQLEKGYALGKNAQFSLIFGVGMHKLAKMLGITLAEAKKLVDGFRGIKDKHSGIYSDGSASHLCNGQARMSRGMYPKNMDWAVGNRTNRNMQSILLQRDLPDILSPLVSGKEDITTKNNATIQAGDVDFLNFIVGKVGDICLKEGIRARFSHSVHDAMLWICKDEDTARLVEIIRKVHRNCYETLFDKWRVDYASVPNDVWYPQTIDVTQRWLKAPDYATVKKSRTISFKGYSGLELDDDWFESKGLVRDDVYDGQSIVDDVWIDLEDEDMGEEDELRVMTQGDFE